MVSRAPQCGTDSAERLSVGAVVFRKAVRNFEAKKLAKVWALNRRIQVSSPPLISFYEVAKI